MSGYMRPEQLLVALLGAAAEAKWGSGWGSGSWNNGKGKGKGKGSGKGKGKGKRSMGKFARQFGGKQKTDFFNLLAGALGKKLKRSMTKEDIVCTFVEEEVDGKPSVEASITSSEFDNSIGYTGKGPTTAAARMAAAKEAVKEEFPEVFQARATKPKKAAAKAPAKKKKKDSAKKEPKANNGDLGSGPIANPKGDVCNVIALVLRRPVAKTDCVWEYSNGDKNATLRVPELTTDSFEGTGDTKKEAENDAATKALEALKPLAENSIQGKEHLSKKRRRELYLEQLDKFAKIAEDLKVFVSPVPEAVTDAEIKKLFAPAGKVQTAERMVGSKSAVVVFENADSAAKAMKQMQGKSLGGSTINVGKWTKKPKK